jgi:DNA-binding HxlR family transcriptional regulator
LDFNTLYDALHFFSHRSTLEILAVLERRRWRYSALIREVQREVPSSNTVNDALHRLVEAGLVSHEGLYYSLTERGKLALPLTKEYVERLEWWARDQQGDNHEFGRHP